MATSDSISENVTKYEYFLNETLRGDLERNQSQQELIHCQISDYQQLRIYLNQLKCKPKSENDSPVQTDIGCHFYVQAVLKDTSRVLMYCGLGIYLEMELDNAVKFSEQREKLLEEKLQFLIKQSGKIKETTKMIEEGLRELQQLS